MILCLYFLMQICLQMTVTNTFCTGLLMLLLGSTYAQIFCTLKILSLYLRLRILDIFKQ